MVVSDSYQINQTQGILYVSSLELGHHTSFAEARPVRIANFEVRVSLMASWMVNCSRMVDSKERKRYSISTDGLFVICHSTSAQVKAAAAQVVDLNWNWEKRSGWIRGANSSASSGLG